MTSKEIDDIYQKALTLGLESLVMAYKKPKSKPPTGYEIHPRVRTPFGICQVVYELPNDRYSIVVKTHQLKLWLIKAGYDYDTTSK